MNVEKFNSEKEFLKWKKRNVGDATMFEFGDDIDSPTMYPCVVVYDTFENPLCDNADMEEQYDRLQEEGYDSDEIELMVYHFVYPTDFE